MILSGRIGIGLVARLAVLREEDLEFAAVLAADAAHGPGLRDQFLDGGRGPEDLLVEPDDDAADGLADRPTLLALARHVAVASAGVAPSTAVPGIGRPDGGRRMASAANPARIAIQPAATNAGA